MALQQHGWAVLLLHSLLNLTLLISYIVYRRMLVNNEWETMWKEAVIA
jgi:hypothetical protein